LSEIFKVSREKISPFKNLALWNYLSNAEEE
jgi:hypothetical protein